MKHLKIRTLKKGFCESDHMLLHAAFQVLVDFMEQSNPQIIDWNSDRQNRNAWKEMRELYIWWTKKRTLRKSPLDDKRLNIPKLEFEKVKDKPYSRMIQPDRKKYANYYKAMRQDFELEKRWLQEDTDNLHRLVNIRGFLWT